VKWSLLSLDKAADSVTKLLISVTRQLILATTVDINDEDDDVCDTDAILSVTCSTTSLGSNKPVD